MNFFPNLQIIFNLNETNDRGTRRESTRRSNTTDSSPSVSQIIQRILRPTVPLAQQMEDNNISGNDVHFYVNLDGLYSSSASSMTIEQIHDMTILSVLGSDSPAVLCTVCQNPCEPGSIVQTIRQCYHVFHPVCIERWLSQNNSCPVCRSTLVPASTPIAEE